MNISTTRRGFMKTAGAAAVTLPLAGCTAKQRQKPDRKPNIVYILADDMGYGDPRCLNPESKVPTPNMDRLAHEGRTFTDAHSPSAVCTPTRYGVLTGRYCWRTHLKDGVLWGYSPNLIEPGRLTVPALLKKHGYTTAGIGKWHLGLGDQEKTDYSKPLNPCPIDHGFDYYYGIPASLDMDPYLYIENNHAESLPTDTVEGREMPEFWRGGPIQPGMTHEGVLPKLTDKAVGWLDSHAENSPDTPFFLYFPLTAPHTPWVPTEEFRGKSGAGPYGDFVAQVDWTVGRVLDALDRHDLADNTLVILTSDNGAHEDHIDPAFNHDPNYIYRGQKADIWDGGHRIPFIVRWPGKAPAGSTTAETVCLTDLLATCAAITGDTLPPNAGEDSISILPAITGDAYDGPLREATVHHSLNGMFSIRQGDWKLVLGCGSGGFHWTGEDRNPPPDAVPGQLYNLSDDIAEEHNLYTKYPDVVERMTALLDRYKEWGHSRRM